MKSLAEVKKKPGKKEHGLTKWTRETIALEAAKYSRRSEFKENAFGAYLKARSLGILDEVCDHMHQKWNVEKIKKIAQNYSDKNDFRKGDKVAYNAAKRLGCFEEVTSWMTDNHEHRGRSHKWNEENIREILPQFDSVSDFCRRKGRAYLRALDLGMSAELAEFFKNKKEK